LERAVPGWLKILLIIAAVIVLLVVAVAGAAVYWWMRNKDALIAKGNEVVAQGQEFGRHTDYQGCVDESISRYKKEPGLTSVISNNIFMQICLDNSRPTAGFCADVPKQMEFRRTAEWRIARCRQVDLEADHYCQQLFTPIQTFCEKETHQPKGDENTNGY
jgi:hypothetical protein